jgi:hypothetical protein
MHFKNSSSKGDSQDTIGTDVERIEPSGMRQQYYCIEKDSPAEVVAVLAYNIETGREEWTKGGQKG